MRASLAIYARVRPVQALEDLGVLILVALAATGLLSIHPIFKWWIGALFIKAEEGDELPGNVNLLAFRVPVLGPIYGLAIAFVLPVMCFWEEEIFRQGTHSWPEAIVRSIAFGAAHILVGIPVGVATALIILGLWLSLCYFQGGINLSTVHHTTYDLIVILLLGIGLFVSGKDRKAAEE